MIAQRMGSQGSGNDFIRETSSEALIAAQDPKSNSNLNPNPLASQGSLYNLTLDEVQNQLGDIGKPLSSVNLDELLKCVFTAEANNVDFRDPASSSSFKQPFMVMDLSKKTVDEVWQDIQQGKKSSGLEGKVTLGEMTLEEFLVKAGVVAEAKKNLGGVEQLELLQQTQWMNFPIPLMNSQQQRSMVPGFMPGHPAQQQLINTLAGNPSVNGAFTETQATLSSSPLMGTLSDTQLPRRKRVPLDDIAERGVERKQKRMIKNRESAARSRARKLAYTHELENKVSCLEEENDRLKKQKELEKVLPAIPLLEPKYQLRRTSSAPI